VNLPHMLLTGVFIYNVYLEVQIGFFDVDLKLMCPVPRGIYFSMTRILLIRMFCKTQNNIKIIGARNTLSCNVHKINEKLDDSVLKGG
jgi:hypothetical protein